MKRIPRILASLAISCAAAAALASTASSGARSQTWDEFWLAHHVEPSPPKGFLGTPPRDLQVLNLTNGAIDDATARRWAGAAWRRGQGDRWAECNLRMDLINSGVLGPPGLNGTDQFVKAELAMGTKSLTCNPGADAVKVAVIAVTDEMKSKHAAARLTPYVIVSMSRINGSTGTRTRADGSRETVSTRRKKGELIWQLDTGQVRDSPVIGRLWYQANGFSCRPDGSTPLDDICGLVKPD
jgi:hypothetical protein